jgi:hypothetical protein
VELNQGDGDFKVRTYAVQNYSAEDVSLLLNRGDGTFRPKHDYLYQFEGESIAIDDLSGDHRTDIAFLVHNSRNYDNWLAVLVNSPGCATSSRSPG